MKIYKCTYGNSSENLEEHTQEIIDELFKVYPNGRMNPTIIKGIPLDQDVINLPIKLLSKSDANLPVLIGERMAQSLKVGEGDDILLRWRDKNGTYDAANITIAEIFDSNVTAIDNGQIWMPIEKLWQMTGLTNEATMYIVIDDDGGEGNVISFNADDALNLVIEMGFIDPVVSNQGSVYTDNNGKLYSL